MPEFVPITQPLPVPAAVRAPPVRLSGANGGFEQAKLAALAQAAVLTSMRIAEAHQSVVQRSAPASYAVTEKRQAGLLGEVITGIDYQSMDVVVQFALDHLRAHSPVGDGRDPHPGLYRDSHMVFIDGRSVPDAKSWKPGQVVHISNPVPYARKVELGFGVSFEAPNYVYEEVIGIVHEKFPQFRYTYLFMPVREGGIQDYARSLAGRAASRQRGGDLKTRRGWLVAQPTIMIRAK